MVLTLEVTAPQAAKLGEASRRVFSAAGGSIGREMSNDWVLSHTKVSARHAVISYQHAVFYIEDMSTNGVFINSPQNRLVRGRPYALKAGDRIYIDPYEIQVSITSEQNAAALHPFAEVPEGHALNRQGGASNPFDVEDPFLPQRSASSTPLTPPSAMAERPAEAVPGQELDPLKLLDPAPKHTPVRRAPSTQDPEHSSLLGGHYEPPAVVPAPSPAPPPGVPLIPPDYDPLAPDDPADISPPPPSAPPDHHPPAPTAPADMGSASKASISPARVVPATVRPPGTSDAATAPSDEAATSAASTAPGDSDLTAVLDGAGLETVRVTPELARSFGRILRVVVSGVMDVLRARQHIKDEFRMRMTHFRAADNNPLKFSANVDDALHNLLVKRNAAYLGPVEAFEDAFDDLRDHQIAMLAGMRVAFESMLAEFAPDRLQPQFDRQLKRGSLPGVASKLRYWDLYRDRCDDIAKDPEASFRNLFGEVFAQAYEEQLNRLKAERRAQEETARAPRQDQR
ncbi:MAG: type VI secretion system-associated FHA domain protein TagH [Luteitalea sp.]|nr:type VI secretion system-associated FHA domain protein TagH [Luteitalea sp.]